MLEDLFKKQNLKLLGNLLALKRESHPHPENTNGEYTSRDLLATYIYLYTREVSGEGFRITGNTLGHYERAKYIIPKKTLNILADYFEMDAVERHYWHGLADYVPISKLPTKDEMKKLNDKMDEIDATPYPILLADFKWTIWAANPSCIGLNNNQPNLLAQLVDSVTNAFQLIYDSQLPFISTIEDAASIQKDQTYRYILRNQLRRHEPFYQYLPRYLESILLHDDYKNFKFFWDKGEKLLKDNSLESQVTQVTPEITFMTDVGPIRMQNITESVDQLNGVFELTRFIPVEQDKELADNYFSQWLSLHQDRKDRFKLWNSHNINDGFIKKYNSPECYPNITI